MDDSRRLTPRKGLRLSCAPCPTDWSKALPARYDYVRRAQARGGANKGSVSTQHKGRPAPLGEKGRSKGSAGSKRKRKGMGVSKATTIPRQRLQRASVSTA